LRSLDARDLAPDLVAVHLFARQDLDGTFEVFSKGEELLL